MVELLEGPVLTGEGEKAGLVIKARAEKDDVVGWCRLRDDAEKQLLKTSSPLRAMRRAGKATAATRLAASGFGAWV